MCGFVYVWVCVCVGFVMCECDDMCICIYCVLYRLNCVFCIISFMYIYSCFVFTSVRTTAPE